ncbi:hypothetical protein BJ878DRAFT_568254 [Calycina marina]|uniref:Uncharacterized protein n=1 Tax=Calycina marina TaxID=1763456 RepID=A0A9P7Z225_9HELO|nr:hypothetical protein BJ878DRAFT_568254 [Calycina marina]
MEPMDEKADLSDLPLLPDSYEEHSLSQSGSSGTEEFIPRQYTRDTFLPSPETTASRRRGQLYIITITVFISCLMTSLIIAGLLSYTHNSISTPFIYDNFFATNAPGTVGCGSTVAEAKALGCHFDELGDMWLPERCPRTYEAEYLVSNNGGPFFYYTNIDGKELVANRSELAGLQTYYSSTRDHLRHCEYNFYRFADSLVSGERVGHENKFGPHMHHCAQILGQFANLAPNIDNIDVDTVSTFGYC